MIWKVFTDRVHNGANQWGQQMDEIMPWEDSSLGLRWSMIERGRVQRQSQAFDRSLDLSEMELHNVFHGEQPMRY